MSFLSNLFGGNSAPQIQYTPSGITNQTGFSISPKGDVSQSSALNSAIGSLSNTFGQAANAFGALGQTVAPGFSLGRQAGLQQISNTFAANRSNLQDTLAQRRILGSSFANSQFSQQAADEAQTRANFEVQSYLQELNASQQLTQQQFNAATQQYSSYINQQNIESSTAVSLTASNNQIAAQIASTNAQLQAQAQAGAGSFLGTLLGLGTGTLNSTLGGSAISGLGSGISSGLSSIFGGAGGASAFAAGAPAIDTAGLGGMSDLALLAAV